MLDFLSQLRLKSIFNPQQMSQNMGGPGPVGMPPPDMSNAIPPVAAPSTVSGVNPFNPNAPNPVQSPSIMGSMEDYKAEHEAKDRLDELLSSYPVYQKPGWLRAIAAGLAATGTHRPQDIPGMMHGKYNRELADWKTKATFAEKAADNENQRNVNNRTLAYQTTQNRLREEALKDKEKADAKKAEIAEANLRIRQFKMDHPNVKMEYIKGGNVMYFDPNAKKMVDTGIASGLVDEMTKMDTQQTNALERIDAQGANAANVAGINAASRETINDTRGWVPIDVIDPTAPGGKRSMMLHQATGEVKPLTMPGGKEVDTSVARIGTTGAGKTTQPANIKAIQMQAQEALDLINNEILESSDKNKPELRDKMRPEIQEAVSWSRLNPFGYAPGSQRRKGDAAINRLKAEQLVSLIGEMKAQSRTGATGFGALNLRELAVLEAAASKLDTLLDETTFRNELTRIRERLMKIVQPEESATPTVTPKTPSTVDDYLKKYAPTPVAPVPGRR